MALGLLFGGFRLALAGVYVEVPLILLGVYLSYRGWRIYQHEESVMNGRIMKSQTLKLFEKTDIGKAGIGVLLIFFGTSASSILLGAPLFFGGLALIYFTYQAPVRKMLSK